MILNASVLLLFVITVAMAFRHGEAPERFGATIMLGMVCVMALRIMLAELQITRVDWIGSVSDLVAFAAFVSIALQAVRIWPIWAASFQLLAVMAHIVRLLDIEIHPFVYILMRSGPTYAVWIALGIGTVMCMRRRKIGVNMPNWRNWSQ